MSDAGGALERHADRGETLPENNAGYLDPQYWDHRFETEDEYEWFRSYASFRHLIQREIRPTDRILILGNGNSNLPFELLADGYKNVTSTDLSPVVTERMRRKAEARGAADISWCVEDMMALSFAEGSFDAVIEKGVFDVLMVDNKDPWNPNPEVRGRIRSALSESHRVLSPSGCLLSITFAGPHFRRPLLKGDRGGGAEFSWRVASDTFGEGEGWYYYLYTLRKGQRAPGDPDSDDEAAKEAREPLPSMLHEEMDSEEHFLGAFTAEGEEEDTSGAGADC